MKSSLPKVLQPLLGRTLLGHVLAAATAVRAERTLVVVGHRAEQVREHLARIAPDALPVMQAEQHGTGHAVRIALQAAPDAAGTVVVLNGDVPLLRSETVEALVAAHEAGGNGATVLAAEVADPSGLGRIVRDTAGNLERIVEERDTTAAQRALREINAGIYAFDAGLLREALGKLSTDNDQGEEYLTDVFELLGGVGHRVGVHVAADADETLGCNDRAELAGLRALMRDRINTAWMRSGVSILDPATTWIDVSVTLEPDATVDRNTALQGATTIAAGATVGPDTTLIDTTPELFAFKLRRAGVTSIVVKEIPKVVGLDVDFSSTPFAVTAENLLLLRHIEIDGDVRRLLSVLKMRESGYDSSVREFEITAQGVRVLAQIRAAGALTGIARH